MKMKPSQPLLKMIIRLLILLILLVCMFLITAFLYSARYWPDVYNYINANITIKRIPTISELDIQIIEVNVDYTTETYPTTDIEYFELSTIHDFDIDEFMKDELKIRTKVKRNIEVEEMKDYKELPARGIFVDYIFLEEPAEMNKNDSDTYDTEDILRTVVTGQVVDEEINTAKNAKVNKDTAITEKYINNQIVKRTINEEFDTNQKNTEISITKYPIEHITTKEGYLVGEEPNHDHDQPTVTPLDITTDVNENDDEEQGTRLIKDLVDVSKLTTRSADVEMVTGHPRVILQRMADGICNGNSTCESFTKTVFPWVAAIFIKNDSENSQFNYICDGALVSENIILTDGRCMLMANETVKPENVLVFLGKGNLQSMASTEELHRIKMVKLHPNFTREGDEKPLNDLALLVIEQPATISESIQSACINPGEEGELEEAATTAWGPNGQLLPIFFEKEKSDICFDRNEDVFCATYGLQVALCPSYGGLYATKRAATWCLQGVFYGDPADRGLCFNRNVLFTSLNNYIDWIDDVVEMNKLYIL